MPTNTDLNQRVVLDTHAQPWTPAESGISRRELESDDAKPVRRSALVRYEPGAQYPHHTHPGGEELLILEGTLSDENGEYGPGSYVRYPDGSAHAPFSKSGCTLLVKVNQLLPGDRERLVRNFRKGEWQGPADGVQRQTLHDDEAAGFSLYVSRFAPGAKVPHHVHSGGEELLVLEGALQDEHGQYPAGTWIRQPHGSAHAPFSPKGAMVLVRRGHLPK